MISADQVPTVSRSRVSVLSPQADDIRVLDIASGLSKMPVLNGQTSGVFFSLAQHAVVVSRVCDRRHALWGLLRRSSFAYTGPTLRAVQRHLSEWPEIEGRILSAIAARYGLPGTPPRNVDRAAADVDDWALLHFGADTLSENNSRLGNLRLRELETCWPPDVAYFRFIERFLELRG